jgi:hypothetical protein
VAAAAVGGLILHLLATFVAILMVMIVLRPFVRPAWSCTMPVCLWLIIAALLVSSGEFILLSRLLRCGWVDFWLRAWRIDFAISGPKPKLALLLARGGAGRLVAATN